MRNQRAGRPHFRPCLQDAGGRRISLPEYGRDCRAVRISKKHDLHHFPSKEEIIISLAVETMDRRPGMFQRAAEFVASSISSQTKNAAITSNTVGTSDVQALRRWVSRGGKPTGCCLPWERFFWKVATPINSHTFSTTVSFLAKTTRKAIPPAWVSGVLCCMDLYFCCGCGGAVSSLRVAGIPASGRQLSLTRNRFQNVSPQHVNAAEHCRCRCR